MTHSEIRDLLPAYALDSLGPLDQLEVRSHLELCNECDEILRDYNETAGELALLASMIEPSAELRKRLMNEAESTRQLLPVVFRTERWRMARAGALASATVVVALGAVAGVVTNRMSEDRVLIPEMVSLLSSPDVEAIAMTSTGEDPDASGQVLVPQDGRAAAVIITGLDDPGEGTYQLSVVVRKQTVKVASFQPDASGAAVVLIRRNLESLESVMVTHGPAGGRSQAPERLILKSP